MFKIMLLLTFLSPSDSIGTKELNGKRFILHRVLTGETLFSISRRYKLKPYQIKAVNPSLEQPKIGEVILIPMGSASSTPASTLSLRTGLLKTHKVESGETVFSLSQLYGISTKQIQRLNNLKNNQISEGQILKIGTYKVGPGQIYTLDSSATTHIVSKGETAILISEKYKIPLELIYKNNNLTTNMPLVQGEELIIAPRAVVLLQGNAEYSYYTPDPLGMPTHFDEQGTGAVILTSTESGKNIALHTPQTIGRYIKIFFPGTKRAIMAKVVGEVPAHERKRGIIVKISKNACKSLGIINSEFPVILQYENP